MPPKQKSKLEQSLEDAGAKKITSSSQPVDIGDTAGELGELRKLTDYEDKEIVITKARYNKGKFGAEVIAELSNGDSIHIANQVAYEQLMRIIDNFPKTGLSCVVKKVKGNPDYFVLASAKKEEEEEKGDNKS